MFQMGKGGRFKTKDEVKEYGWENGDQNMSCYCLFYNAKICPYFLTFSSAVRLSLPVVYLVHVLVEVISSLCLSSCKITIDRAHRFNKIK